MRRGSIPKREWRELFIWNPNVWMRRRSGDSTCPAFAVTKTIQCRDPIPFTCPVSQARIRLSPLTARIFHLHRGHKVVRVHLPSLRRRSRPIIPSPLPAIHPGLRFFPHQPQAIVRGLCLPMPYRSMTSARLRIHLIRPDSDSLYRILKLLPERASPRRPLMPRLHTASHHLSPACICRHRS